MPHKQRNGPHTLRRSPAPAGRAPAACMSKTEAIDRLYHLISQHQREKAAAYKAILMGICNTKPVNWLDHPSFPRELRNKIYDYILDPTLRVYDGKLVLGSALPRVNRKALVECVDWMVATREYRFIYRDISALHRHLEANRAGELVQMRHSCISNEGRDPGHCEIRVVKKWSIWYKSMYGSEQMAVVDKQGYCTNEAELLGGRWPEGLRYPSFDFLREDYVAPY